MLIIEIALSIVLAVIILALLPDIIVAGIFLVCAAVAIGFIAALIAFLATEEPLSPGAITTLETAIFMVAAGGGLLFVVGKLEKRQQRSRMLNAHTSAHTTQQTVSRAPTKLEMRCYNAGRTLRRKLRRTKP